MSHEHSRSTESPANSANGLLMLLIGLLLLAAGPIIIAQNPDSAVLLFPGLSAAAVGLLLVCGLYSLQPNEGMAIMLFGSYRGTDR